MKKKNGEEKIRFSGESTLAGVNRVDCKLFGLIKIKPSKELNNAIQDAI